MKRAYLSLVLLSMLTSVALAQGSFDGVDGIVEETTIERNEIIEYDDIREADIFWSKRIWRVIDTREKMNLRLRYPKKALIDVIHNAAKLGELEVYRDVPGADGDFNMMEQMPPDEVKGIGAGTDTLQGTSPITLRDTVYINTSEFKAEDVIKYRIKEDWFFDEETSTFQVRIIGIAPVFIARTSDGTEIGDETMYWIYYPDLRNILVRHEAYNPYNDVSAVSWDHIFEARLFDSYIYKESNVYDRPIQSYAIGLDALFESDNIKQDLFEFEHDLWSY